MSDFLNYNASFVTSKDSHVISVRTVGDLLGRISDGRYESLIQRARQCVDTDEDSYRAIKLRLHAILFSGVFEGGKSKGQLKEYNRLLVLDLDHLSDEQLDRSKRVFLKDPYVCAFWLSPSGHGLKGLVELGFGNEVWDVDLFHSTGFSKVYLYFKEKYDIELDRSGSNVNRLCFVSYDPELHINPEARVFSVEIEPPKRLSKIEVATHRSRVREYSGLDYKKYRFGRNKPESRAILNSIIKYLRKHKKSITFSYEEWLSVAFAISETFNYDVGEKYFLALSKLDGPPKYNEQEAIQLLRYCYAHSRGEISLGTIIFMAKNKGYYLKTKANIPKLGN